MDDEVFNIMKKSVEAMDAEEAYNAIKKSVEAINTRPYATLVEYEKVECIKLLLTAYEKQQKEIENYQILKDDIEGHRIVYVDTPEFEEKYISKDKIEEKIKELESHIWRDGYMTKFDRYAIHYLKELLGE